jgi:acyl-CoA synthetase (AMP-forming)/AMP-acid ligase II
MLTDQQIQQDLEQLKTIAGAKMASGEFAVHKEVVQGVELDVFSNIPASLGDYYQLAHHFEDLCFLVYQEERFSFGETLTLARRFSRALIEKYGVQKGDRVAICARNSPEWCMAFIAITQIGAIAVPMNSWWQGREIEYGLKDSGCKLIITDPLRLAHMHETLGKLGIAAVIAKPEGELCADYPEFYSLATEFEPLSDDDIAQCKVAADDRATILYTSGSTGNPKGVLSSHRNTISALYTWKFVKEITETLRPELREENPEHQAALLANVPLFHCTGSHAQFLSSFLYERKFVMMYKWNAEQALELIEKERISILHGVPTMAWEVMQSEKFASADLSSLRSVQAGGAPRPPEQLNLIVEKFPEKAIPGLGYGLTETNAIGAIISGVFYLARPNSTGRPTPPVTSVRIVDESGAEVPAGGIGEVCIKGPTVMHGYWNQPEATAEVIKDGWFHTGDIGMLDSLGFLILLDRAKDIVIRGGENIGCAEVEYAIAEHPCVSEVSVYGIPDTRLGEVPCATIMLKKETSLDEAQLKEHLASRLAAFKIPERFYFQYEQLPRIATGKIAKKELRANTLESLKLEA